LLRYVAKKPLDQEGLELVLAILQAESEVSRELAAGNPEALRLLSDAYHFAERNAFGQGGNDKPEPGK